MVQGSAVIELISLTGFFRTAACYQTSFRLHLAVKITFLRIIYFQIKFIFLLKKFIRFLFWPDVSLLKNTYSGDKISKYSGSSFERNRIPAGLGWLQVVEYWRLELLECRKHMTRKRFADFLSSSDEIKTTTVLKVKRSNGYLGRKRGFSKSKSQISLLVQLRNYNLTLAGKPTN